MATWWELQDAKTGPPVEAPQTLPKAAALGLARDGSEALVLRREDDSPVGHGPREGDRDANVDTYVGACCHVHAHAAAHGCADAVCISYCNVDATPAI